jgi:hypothetical protein
VILTALMCLSVWRFLHGEDDLAELRDAQV